jgi:hypothetical protein
MIIHKPTLLSIHPTMQCDYGCFNCYLKLGEDDNRAEKSPEFFLGLVGVAKRLGMKDVAIPVNYVKDLSTDKNTFYYKEIKAECIKQGLDFSLTCNYDFVKNHKGDFDNISLMSVSVNDFVTPTDETKQEAIEVMRQMKSVVGEVNCNILLSENMVKQLNNGLAEKILEVANTIYLLSSKPLFIPHQKVYQLIGKLKPELMAMIEDRILIDTCIKMEMGLTGGICSKHDFIYVNPYGEIKMCSYDQRNLFILEKPDDLEYIYGKYPSDPLKTCDLINGEFLKEKKKKLIDARVISTSL